MGLNIVPVFANSIEIMVGMGDGEDETIAKRLVTAYGVQVR